MATVNQLRMLTKVVDTSGTDTYTATLVPAITALVANQVYTVRFTEVNTGASTLNLNSLGAKPIVKRGNFPLIARDLFDNQPTSMVYDGSSFILLSNETSQDIKYSPDGTIWGVTVNDAGAQVITEL